jgi:hypothetical protein
MRAGGIVVRNLALVIVMAMPVTGCTPAYEFFVFNASKVAISLRGHEACAAAPGRACKVRSGPSFEILQASVTREYRPVAAIGGRALREVAEQSSWGAPLIRLRFDGSVTYLVAPKDDSWAPVHPQPRGFPLKAWAPE